MNIDTMKNAIGLIGSDLIEAADETPVKSARVTAFTKRPWLQWAAAAVILIVIAVGTPLAVYTMGAFQTKHYAQYGSDGGGSGNSGVVTPIGGSSESGEPDSSSEQSAEEGSNSSENDSSSHGGASTGTPSGSSAETPDVSSSGAPEGSDLPEQPEGDFVKENMPPVTYRINGEYKTFDYQSSTAVIDSGSSYVVDHYAGSDGSTVSKYAGAEGFTVYDACVTIGNYSPDILLSEPEAVEKAKKVALNTSLSLNGLDNSEATAEFTDNGCRVILSVAEGSIEVFIDYYGELLRLAVMIN